MPVKATINQLKGFLKVVGVPDVEVVEDEAASDFDTNTVLAEIDKSRTPIIKSLLEGDIKTEAESAATGRLVGTIATFIANKTGIPRAEIAHLSYKDMLQKGFDHLGQNLEGDKATWAKQLEEMATTHQNTLTEKEKEWGEKVKVAEDRYRDRDITEALEVILKDAPFLPSTDRKAAANLLKRELNGSYNLHYDEATKELSLRDKSNPDLPVYNETKTAVLKPFDKAKDIFTPFGLWQTDTRNINPAEAARNGKQHNSYQPSNTKETDASLRALDEFVKDVQIPVRQ